MKVIISKLIVTAAAITTLVSCSPKLVGTWNIEKYDVNEAGKSSVSVSKIGSITFNKDNSGVKDIKYSIFQNDRSDQAPFKWFQENTNTIRIEGQTSDFTKTWLIIEDGKKEQIWKSTDGENKVQTLKLTKQKQ